MALKLSVREKDNFRRLTQKANRRIKMATKQYEKEGLSVLPKKLTGGLIQHRSEWQTKKNPLSRSFTRFKTKREFNQYVNKLRQFDIPDSKGGVPTYTEYQSIGAMKMKQALDTSLGGAVYRNVPPEIQEALDRRIDNMGVEEQAKFWKAYSVQSQKMLLTYSSEVAMQKVMDEIFLKEDLKPLIIDSIVEMEDHLSPRDKREYKRKLKYYGNQMLIDHLNEKR